MAFSVHVYFVYISASEKCPKVTQEAAYGT